MNDCTRYCRDLATRTGDCWNQFWFAASDPYSTSVLRILVGLVTCWWLAGWGMDLQKLLGAEGWLPLSTMLQWRGNRGFSLLDYAGTGAGLWLVYLAAVAAAVMFTIGLYTRVTSIATAVLVISFLWRAPMLHGEMELVMSMLLVYLCIAPCGAYLSVDQCLRDRRNKQDKLLARGAEENPILYSSAATVSLRLIQVHLTLIFVSMLLAKFRGAVWWSGEAVWWMAARPDSRLVDFTPLLTGKLPLVNLWTHAMVLFEMAFVVLVWNRWTRPLVLALSVPAWLSVALLTGMVGYALLMLIASLAFVSPSVMRSVLERRGDAQDAQTRSEPAQREAAVSAGS